ncbi:ATP-dependent nuclease [Haloglycomyces albus]|uniref:ATP-dependent nuclease n=1 Tax=Haloglycomyces albus TaxID=526067 RepID=UPI00046D3588|nr:AAA family ATPase [Haloglycomyces albus]
MRIRQLRVKGFQSFGPEPRTIDLEDITYILGPNGSGKTVVLEALSRLFSPIHVQRKIRVEDFHVPFDRDKGAVQEEEPTLWIEVDIEFPEAGDNKVNPTVPSFFPYMAIKSENDVPRIRVRLTAQIARDGEVEERLEYVLRAGEEDDEPIETATMSRYDRAEIEVHYLPARRDPADHISYATASLIGRVLRATDWSSEREPLTDLMSKVTDTVAGNDAVSSIGERLAREWSGLHTGAFFKDPSIAFGRGELEDVLRQLTVMFSPSHSATALPFERLSDGQKSLLYISLVLAWQSLAQRVLSCEETSFDPTRLRPPVHTIIALEEPENSLAPQYLGRIIRQLRNACDHGNVQVLVATHAPTMLRRVDPESICFLRLNDARESIVRRIVLPDDDQVAAKYVREAVQAFPELYFSRLVVLGEGDSEQVVLPRVLAAAGIAEDDASVSVVPLGGRHVNHFWRLLSELEVPYVTLLDLDSGRWQGGWGRVRYAMKKVNEVHEQPPFEPGVINGLPEWNDKGGFPQINDPKYPVGRDPLNELENCDVFFSHPVDLDMMLLKAFPGKYEVTPETPSTSTIRAVLGKNHVNEYQLDDDVWKLFPCYDAKFGRKSKPATHLRAMSGLDDKELLGHLPAVLDRLVNRVKEKLKELPE